MKGRIQVMQETAQALPPEARLQGMLGGVLVTQMLAVAARLGIADRLADGPRHHEELAAELSISSSALYRLLRALASHGVFAEEDEAPGSFSTTPIAELLRSDVPGSQRSWAMLHGAPWLWNAVGHMPHSIRTGSPAFHDLYGSGTFEYFAQQPEHGEVFFAAMNQVTEMLLPALLAAYDFSPFKHVIDVGGGLGSLLAAVLHQQPQLTGTLYDLPYMRQGATEYLQAQGVAERCEVVSGDFFESVPRGGDLHILKWIIHDWDDELAVKILRNCRAALEPGGRLLLVEQVLSDGNAPCAGKMLDIFMLLMERGKERHEAEFAALFEAAGLRLNRRIPLLGSWSVLEALPV